MSFQDIATQIIKDSITSSIYIDDKLVEPFDVQTAENSSYYNISRDIYSSFKQENKSIDFYKFELSENWDAKSEYLFKNRDLLVLDWQLDDTKHIKQTDTLKLLKKAISTDNLHFVSIYTRVHDKDQIFYTVKAFFELNYNKTAHDAMSEMIDTIENEGLDTGFLKDLSGKFIELALTKDNSGIQEEIDSKIKEEFGDKYNLFRQKLKAVWPRVNIGNSCEILGYYISKEGYNEDADNNWNINIDYINDGFIVINHTIIQLTNKNDPKPSECFNFFTNALIKVCGNMLTLTSLEIRNLLRESSGFIGKDVDSINEAALFHHQSKNKHFFDFVIDIWKNHSLSFVDYNSDKLKTISNQVWKDYSIDNSIEDKITVLKSDSIAFNKELAKLNVYYNTLHISKADDDIIRFGDVFVELDSQSKQTGKYWLNITAHCDCMEPSANIKNCFYFISGNIEKLETVLNDGDGGFHSYIDNSGSIIPIKWNNRPVILNISNNKIKDGVILSTDGLKKDLSIKYIKTLKENYAQRMANNSFSFAMRVGIDFAQR